MSDEPHYKVVMLGDTGVGKTALVTRITEEDFSDAYIPTVGAQFVALPLEIQGRKMTLELQDTAGQEAYRSLVGFYTRDAKGAFLVTDVTKEQTFETLSGWIRFANEHSEGIRVIIFADKIDLVDERVISKEQIQDFVKLNGVALVEGSAKSGRNITDALEQMGELLLSTVPAPHAPVTVRTEDFQKNNRKKGCC